MEQNGEPVYEKFIDEQNPLEDVVVQLTVEKRYTNC